MTNDTAEGNLSPVLISNAIYANSYKSIDPAMESTGFRTCGLRYRNLSFSHDPRPGEEFLLNSRVVRDDRESALSIENYFVDSSVAMLSLLGQQSLNGSRAVKLGRSWAKLLAGGAAVVFIPATPSISMT
jgi:hypothetical protein